MASIRKGRRGNITRSLEACDVKQLINHISKLQVEQPPDAEEGNSLDDFQDILDRQIDAGREVINLIKENRKHFRKGLTALEAAVMLGHYEIVKVLIAEGVGVSHYLHLKHPLYVALERGYFDIASLLLKHDADVANTAFERTFPMMMALSRTNCSVKIVKDLLAAGFPENGIIDQVSKETALHAAARGGHHEVLEYLLSLPNVDCNAKDNRGQTPLHFAVTKGCAVSVNVLAKRGANLNCECFKHITPLFQAISLGNFEMVRLLIDLGADIHFVNGSKRCGMTPLHFVADCCQFKITKLLLDHGADENKIVPLTGQTALHFAAVADPLNSQANKIGIDCIVEMLLKRGAEMNQRNIFGYTPLHLAIKQDHSSVAKMLIQNGADISSPFGGSWKQTCLHVACRKLDKELITMLIGYGADILAKNGTSYYPCTVLVTSSFSEGLSQSNMDYIGILRYFWSCGFPYDLTLKSRSNENLRDGIAPHRIDALMQKQKLLLSGIKHQQTKVVCKAMAQGAELNSCSVEVRYPLHYTAARGSDQILALLLYGRQTVNWLDKRGESALHAAARAGSVDCCRLLLEHGAVYNHSSPKCRKTPLQLAQEFGHQDVVRMLALVNKHFNAIRKNRFLMLSSNMQIWGSAMNCRDRNGRSLIETGFHHGNIIGAERLMKIKLHTVHPSQSWAI